jgi:hypothetical protein
MAVFLGGVVLLRFDPRVEMVVALLDFQDISFLDWWALLDFQDISFLDWCENAIHLVNGLTRSTSIYTCTS